MLNKIFNIKKKNEVKSYGCAVNRPLGRCFCNFDCLICCNKKKKLSQRMSKGNSRILFCSLTQQLYD